MKKYETPEIIIELFNSENVVTESANNMAANAINNSAADGTNSGIVVKAYWDQLIFQ